jgi:hypothetical protein
MHGINDIKKYSTNLKIKEKIIKLKAPPLIFSSDAHHAERPCSFSITLRAEA